MLALIVLALIVIAALAVVGVALHLLFSPFLLTAIAVVLLIRFWPRRSHR
ncbi:MAG TPA: hypothetical protein VHY58_02545 [Streptosporangiaceae bacterium]|jgi:hypothetical protein|nr:hypothetical protein [Streptosporangiaceae bacterium]